MVITLFGSYSKVIKIGENEMSQIMEDIIHGSLEGRTSIFKSKGHHSVCKCAPWGCETCFILIHVANMNLIITRELVHE